jgi:hypothetical protein
MHVRQGFVSIELYAVGIPDVARKITQKNKSARRLGLLTGGVSKLGGTNFGYEIEKVLGGGVNPSIRTKKVVFAGVDY